MRALYTIVRCRLCKFFIGVLAGAWRWQDCALMRSRALADGKMPAKCVPSVSDGDKVLARCVPGRFAVARFRRDAFPGGNPWQFSTPCIPKGASDGKIAPSWQDSHAMHPKCAGSGKICAPCIRKAPQTAVRGYTARRSCQEGAPFAARAPRIMRGARILPSAAKQRERSQPRRRPYGRRNRARAASCRAG